MIFCKQMLEQSLILLLKLGKVYNHSKFTPFNLTIDYKFNGKPADIWAAGGTLYYFLFGKPPFQSFNGAEDLKNKILEDE